MTLKLWRFYFRAWRPPWKGWEIHLEYHPGFKEPGYKTSVKMFDIKDHDSG